MHAIDATPTENVGVHVNVGTACGTM